MHAMENKGDKKPGHPRERKKQAHTILCSGGERACPGIASGSVYRLSEISHLKDMPRGLYWWSAMHLPRFVTAIENMAAVVMASGSTTSHFSSLTREFGGTGHWSMCNMGFNTSSMDVESLWMQTGEWYMMASTHHHPPHPFERPPANETFFKNSSFMIKLRYVIDFSAKLKLTDPESTHFAPGGCRSLHDIVRFAMKQRVKEMFFTGNRQGRPTRSAKKTCLPHPHAFLSPGCGTGYYIKCRIQLNHYP